MRTLLLAFLSTAFLPAVQIDIPDWEGAIDFELVASQEPIRPGGHFEVAVVVDIEPGYHLYGPEEAEPSRTEVEISGDGVHSGAPVFPPVVRRDLAGLGTYDLYEGQIAIRVPVELEDHALGERTIGATVRFQVCTDAACSAPDSEELSLTIPVAESPPVRELHPEIFKQS